MTDSAYTFDLFDEACDFENTPEKGEAFLRPAVQLTLKYLWENWETSKRPDVFSLDFIKLLWRHQNHVSTFYHAIFIDRDPFFLRAARRGVQESLAMLCVQFNKHPPQTSEDLEKAQLAIHNTLALYAMFCPTPNEPITIPQYIDNQWEIVTYSVTPIELTPTKGIWLNFLSDQDRLFSYGLTPVNESKAHPLLLHCGTGWGTAQGHSMQYLADMWPNKSPGEIFFEWQYDGLNQWISQAYDETNKKVITSGQSLGGSLSYLTALAFPDKIEKAYCLNPPGMAYDYDKNHPYFGAWEKATAQERQDKVIIQKQDDDIVSKCGIFKKDFQLLKVKAVEENPQEAHSLSSMLTAHARSFAHCNQVSWQKSDMHSENHAKRRLQNNRWLYRAARVLVFYGFLAPYFFIFRPIKQFIARHAFEVLIFTTALVLFCTVPPLGALLSLPFLPSLGSTVFSALLPSLAISQLISGFINQTYDFLFNKKEKFYAYIDALKQLTPLERKGKVLYDLANILSLGLLQIGVKTIYKLFIRPVSNLLHPRQSPAEIHTKAFHQKTAFFEHHKAPSFMMKLRVFSLIAVFYVVATPLKFVFYDTPRFLIKKLKTCFSPTAERKEDSLESPSERPSSLLKRQSSRKHKTHYGRFFSCCCREETGKELQASPSTTRLSTS